MPKQITISDEAAEVLAFWAKYGDRQEPLTLSAVIVQQGHEYAMRERARGWREYYAGMSEAGQFDTLPEAARQ